MSGDHTIVEGVKRTKGGGRRNFHPLFSASQLKLGHLISWSPALRLDFVRSVLDLKPLDSD